MVLAAEREKTRRRVQRYSKQKLYAAEQSRAASNAFRDFGAIPKVGNRKRRNKAAKSLRVFCETYLKERFYFGWSPDHLKAIAKLERAIREGGLFALAMPRGSGKTALTVAAALWALLFGYRKYVVLIGATEGLAQGLLDAIRVSLETNDLLLEDFPEVCFPIRKLEKVNTRKLISEGHQVQVSISAFELRLPWIIGGKNGLSAGSIVEVCGITGAIRGKQVALPDGRMIRPDFVIPDDPQTDVSAKKEAQVEAREGQFAGAILGLAGPGKKIAGVCPCTVIKEGDLSDRLLDRNLHPEWNGERIALLQKFPDKMNLWENYKDIWGESLRQHGDIRDATAFYRTHRKEMDSGAVVMWESRFNHDELSALQNAMNLYFADAQAFWSEMQNNPRRDADEELRLQTPAEIAKRVNNLEFGKVPVGTQWITGFVDVQQKALFYCLIAWKADFTGSVLEYGTFPDQGNRRYYQLSDITQTLQKLFPKAGVDGQISAAIREFVPKLLLKRFIREDDEVEMGPNVVLVDANWKSSTVRDAIRFLRSGQVYPSHGRPIGASSNPITEYKIHPGDRVGLNWKTSSIEKLRHVLIDVNFWKSFIHDRLGTEFGDPGSLTFPGRDPLQHRMIAEHLAAEFRVRTTASNGRTVDEFKEKPNKPDNHLLDCVVGCAVGASLMGAVVPGLQGQPVRRKRRRVKVSF